MPYIPATRREDFDALIAEIVQMLHSEGTGYGTRSPGDLNYVLTKIVLGYLYQKKDKTVSHTPHYADLNEAMGVLECVKQELYRRDAAPYEDKKIKENGDVYVWWNEYKHKF